MLFFTLGVVLGAWPRRFTLSRHALTVVVTFAGPPRGQNVQDYQREAIELDTFGSFEVTLAKPASPPPLTAVASRPPRQNDCVWNHPRSALGDMHAAFAHTCEAQCRVTARLTGLLPSDRTTSISGSSAWETTKKLRRSPSQSSRT